MAQQRIPDIVLKLQQMAKPSSVNGHWRRGVLSARRLADVRKSLVAEGIYWPPKPLRNRGIDKPFKLNKHERTRAERYGVNITVCRTNIKAKSFGFPGSSFNSSLTIQSKMCNIVLIFFYMQAASD